MQLNAAIVAAGCGATVLRAAQWTAPLQAACDKYSITAPLDLAAFLATVGVESGRLVYVKEIWGPRSRNSAMKAAPISAIRSREMASDSWGEDSFRSQDVATISCAVWA
jgi:hypothetical protein